MNSAIRLLSLRNAGKLAALKAVPDKIMSFGEADVDARLAGGLPQSALHEIYAASETDGSAAAAFAIMLAIRAVHQRPLLWLREDRCAAQSGHLNAHGLVELGYDPARFILVTAKDTLALLRAAVDSIKCAQVGAVVIEPWGKAATLDLTASRRLAMAAAASGVFTLIVRTRAEPLPSAAHSRWQVSAVPSMPLAANAPGHPAFEISLLRHRGGLPGFEARLEWNRDSKSFERSPPLPRSAFAAPPFREDQARPLDQKRAA